MMMMKPKMRPDAFHQQNASKISQNHPITNDFQPGAGKCFPPPWGGKMSAINSEWGGAFFCCQILIDDYSTSIDTASV